MLIAFFFIFPLASEVGEPTAKGYLSVSWYGCFFDVLHPMQKIPKWFQTDKGCLVNFGFSFGSLACSIQALFLFC
jgi:hypothetical protein